MGSEVTETSPGDSAGSYAGDDVNSGAPVWS